MAAQQYIVYTTRTNDRWDLIAFTFYGDASRFQPILDANPRVPIDPVLQSGVQLAVPVLDVVVATTPLPPWLSAARAAGQV